MTDDELDDALDSLGDRCSGSHKRIAGILYVLSGLAYDVSEQEEQFLDGLAIICRGQCVYVLTSTADGEDS